MSHAMCPGRCALLRERPLRPSCRPFRSIHCSRATARCTDTSQPIKVDLGAGAKGTLIAVLVAGAAFCAPAHLMPPARAEENAFERRQAQLQQRRELLNKARERALESGTSGEDAPGSSAAPASKAAAQVEAANAKVERGNQARQSDFSGAADRLRKLSTAEYEKLSGQSPKAPKEEPASGPSWFNFGGSQAPAPDVRDVPVIPAPPPPPPPPLSFTPTPPPPPPPPAVSTPPPPQVEAPKAEAPKLQLPSLDAAKPEKAAPTKPPGANWLEGFGIDSSSLTQEAPRKPDAKAIVKKVEPAKPQAPQAPQPELLKKEPATAALKEPARKAAEAVKPGKRRGPLPLWLVELVVIAAVPGLLYALLRYEAQVSAGLRQAGELFIQTYDRVFPAPQPREPSP